MRHFFRLLSCFVLLVLWFVPPLFAQWEHDVRLTFGGGMPQYRSGLMILGEPGGYLHAVWSDNRDGGSLRTEIYYKRSTDGGTTWGPDTRLTNNQEFSIFPSVAVSGSNVHVIWEDNRYGNGPHYDIFYKRSTDRGATWSQDTRITFTPVSAELPSLSASAAGVLHLAWTDFRLGLFSSEIYYQRSTDQGMSWSQETRLTSAPPSMAPSISALDSMVHVVWQDYRDGGSFTEIYYNRSTDEGATWTQETRLTYNLGESNDPSVSASGSIVHVVWQDFRDGSANPYYKRSADQGMTWSQDTCLFTSGSAYYPLISASGSNVHVVWGVGPIFYSRSSDRGMTWSQALFLPDTNSNAFYPSLAFSDTMVHVVWWDFRNGQAEIYYKRNPTGNPPSGVETQVGRLERKAVRPLRIFPNPFSSFATIPGHEGEGFTLYDISGRWVSVYRGDRIGEDLSPGVYFILVPREEGMKPVRVVKVR